MKGGELMSGFEIIMIIFAAMTFIVTLIKLMVYILDAISGKRK